MVIKDHFFFIEKIKIVDLDIKYSHYYSAISHYISKKSCSSAKYETPILIIIFGTS